MKGVRSLLMLVALASGGRVGAQTCTHPQPLAAGCPRFIFVDAVGVVALSKGTHQLSQFRAVDDLPSYAGALFGLMFNRDSANAIGFSAEGDYTHLGRGSLKAHWRRWYPSRASFDASAGPLFGDIATQSVAGGNRVRGSGVTTDLSLIGSGGLGVIVGAEYLSGAGRTSFGTHAGVRAESRWTLASAAIAGVLFGFAYIVRDR